MCIRHLLLLAIVASFVGQGVARASTPCAAMSESRVSAIAGMSNCDAAHDAEKSKIPCKNMTAGCLAMTGCSYVAAFDPQHGLVMSPMPSVFRAPWPDVSVLTGRDIAPDPDPPSLLG